MKSGPGNFFKGNDCGCLVDPSPRKLMGGCWALGCRLNLLHERLSPLHQKERRVRRSQKLRRSQKDHLRRPIRWGAGWLIWITIIMVAGQQLHASSGNSCWAAIPLPWEELLVSSYVTSFDGTICRPATSCCVFHCRYLDVLPVPPENQAKGKKRTNEDVQDAEDGKDAKKESKRKRRG